ncbi:MAG: pyrimidine dimer DNA glycosylase/endonuclease V [Anaerolineaceae bacterium]|nr:pyrimidine dimer DNA glycosylase/endonuclease V [Anaerolineaceae bacterium]
MRLWSLHPQYLDRQGLSAVWREALLAQAVLFGATKGYLNHPQLLRFKACEDPLLAIGAYLAEVQREAARRAYQFNAAKIAKPFPCMSVSVTEGQLAYEWQHLLRKLEKRTPTLFLQWKGLKTPLPHPVFAVKPGPIEVWEKI